MMCFNDLVESGTKNANKLFLNKWDYLILRSDKLDAKKPCMHTGCDFLRRKRIMFLVGMHVQEADVCRYHASEYHGKKVVTFPFKKYY